LSDVREMPPEELIKTIGKMLDVAQDSGVSVGPSQSDMLRNVRTGMSSSSPVRFIVSDAAEIREKVYAQAVSDARARANRLATLNQVRLGAVVSIQEVANQAPKSLPLNYLYNMLQAEEPDDGESGVSATLPGAALKVKLLVRFAIEPPAPRTAQQ